MARLVCPKCLATLGDDLGDRVVFAYRGRRIEAREALKVKCRCGSVWLPTPAALLAAKPAPTPNGEGVHGDPATA
jgi:hypothetical protein